MKTVIISLILGYIFQGWSCIAFDLTTEPDFCRPGWTRKPTFWRALLVMLLWAHRPFLEIESKGRRISGAIWAVIIPLISTAIVFWGLIQLFAVFFTSLLLCIACAIVCCALLMRAFGFLVSMISKALSIILSLITLKKF